MQRNKYVSSSKSSAISSSKKVDTKLVTEDYKKYEDKISKKIKVDGMEKMGSTLEIDIYSDLFITYFFYRCNCRTYGEVSLDEYIKGLSSFGANNLDQIKPQIITIKEDLLNIHSEDFKAFYQFLFTFNLEKKTVKLVNPEVYKLYFSDLFSNQFKITLEFLEFMEKDKQSAKLTEDQWTLLLEFLKAIGDEFPQGYNVEESWPTLFDEFYLWYCKKYRIEIPKPEY